MASRTSATTSLSLFTITTFLLVLLLSLLSNATAAYETHDKATSAVGFLEHLKGCHKGDKVEGVKDLKKYLEKFGYLNNGYSDNDEFDDMVESAIKNYQLNYNLKVTGTLDPKTVSKMAMPRCGVPDIIKGTTSMRSGKKRHTHQQGSVHTVAHFSFFSGSPKWPANKYNLTYAFNRGTPSKVFAPVSRAFATWAENTHFTFRQVRRNRSPDLTIGFARGDHGDGAQNAFNGTGWVLAHAFAPTNGRFHFDADEPWAVGAVEGAYDMQTVALHEIGHLLGLMHSSVEGAVMSPTVSTRHTSRSLHGDDVQGIKALYNT